MKTNPTISIIRWILLFPSGILAGIVLLFILHIILYLLLGNFFDTYPELPERILTPFVFTFGFVRFGPLVAPKYNYQVANIFFVSSFLISFTVLMITFTSGKLFGKSVFLSNSGLPVLFGIIGAFIGLFLFQSDYKPTNSDLEKNENSNLETNSFFENNSVEIFYSIILVIMVYSIKYLWLRHVFFPIFLILYLMELLTVVKKEIKLSIKILKFIFIFFMICFLIIGLFQFEFSLYSIYLLISILLSSFIWQIFLKLKPNKT